MTSLLLSLGRYVGGVHYLVVVWRGLQILAFVAAEARHLNCSENKGTDQLCSYCTEADLRLCFRICFITSGFLMTPLIASIAAPLHNFKRSEENHFRFKLSGKIPLIERC